ncbi:serine/threonine-protein kinase [Streptomyces sp. NPDC088727]|uniref:serine/threonine-protein kinase n=1 Tax=Streptomyces sp. NPDC088727 TaxID=3365875 RepID=UPI003803EFF9
MRDEILDGRYRLTEPIGSGGMGRVWQAEDERIGRKVAVKVLPRVDEDTSTSRFTREARVVGGLSSPHIVTLHDFGEARVAGERILYLVMEHLQGRDLGAVLESRRPGLPSPAEVIAWAVEICAGLGTAHRAGIVHRDIKPANILLTAAGTIKILDFGIARMLAPAASMTRTDLTAVGFVIGTPLYMSPEQIRAPDELDSRSDLYSLGCLLHTLLTGVPPFNGAGTTVLAQHLGNAPEPPSARRPELADLPGLDALVLRLLAKEPDERPKDAAEVAALLRAATGTGAGTGHPGTVVPADAPKPPTPTPAPMPTPTHASASTPTPTPAPASAPPAPGTPGDPAAATAMGPAPYTGAPRPPAGPPVSAPAPAPTPTAPFQPGVHPYPAPSLPPERLHIARTTRYGGAATRAVATTWLAGAGTALLTGVLLLLFTPVTVQGLLIFCVAACLVGMAGAQGFTNVFDPLSKSLSNRIGSVIIFTIALGAAGTGINSSTTGNEPTPAYFLYALGACAAALTAGVLIANQVIARFRVPARAALLISMSGWINGIVTWAVLAHASPLKETGALPVACGVWLLTALALGRIMAPAAPRAG